MVFALLTRSGSIECERRVNGGLELTLRLGLHTSTADPGIPLSCLTLPPSGWPPYGVEVFGVDVVELLRQPTGGQLDGILLLLYGHTHTHGTQKACKSVRVWEGGGGESVCVSV